DDSLNSAWFNAPLTKLESIISDSTQRAALLRLFDALFPPATLPGLPDDEKWHPLLGNQPRGNLYFTVKEKGGGSRLGMGGDFGSAGGAELGANIRAGLPLINADAGVQAIAGSATGPFEIDITIHLGWTRPAKPIALEAIVATASLAPPNASLVITLKG